MSDLRRTEQQADGSRVVRKYIGTSTTYAEPGWDAAHNWQDEMTLVDGEIIGGWVRDLGDSINLAPHPSGEGVIVEIGGVRHGIPLDMWEAALADFQKIHAETAVLRTTKRAEKAEREAQAEAGRAQAPTAVPVGDLPAGDAPAASQGPAGEG